MATTANEELLAALQANRAAQAAYEEMTRLIDPFVATAADLAAFGGLEKVEATINAFRAAGERLEAAQQAAGQYATSWNFAHGDDAARFLADCREIVG